MSELDFLRALALGVVQGLSEFLPISSSGHLAIAQNYLGLDPESPTLLLFDVWAHVGTLIAVLFVFRFQVARFATRLTAEVRGAKRPTALRLVALGVIASIPAAVIGLTFKSDIEAVFGNMMGIGICMALTGLVLAGTALAPRGRMGWRTFPFYAALIVGIAQSFAMLPGASRSGFTICAALYLGMRRRWAGEFSFFIGVPAFAGAALIQTVHVLRLDAQTIEAIPWIPILLGAVASLAVGIFALRQLLRTVQQGKLHWFAVYCFILAILLISGILNGESQASSEVALTGSHAAP